MVEFCYRTPNQAKDLNKTYLPDNFVFEKIFSKGTFLEVLCLGEHNSDPVDSVFTKFGGQVKRNLLWYLYHEDNPFYWVMNLMNQSSSFTVFAKSL